MKKNKKNKKNKVIHADAAVKGKIKNGNKAFVKAKVSCVNGVPTGKIEGTAKVFVGPGFRKFRFFSDNAQIVATIKSPKSLGALFSNVTVQEDEFTPITGCNATINATKLDSNHWIGSFTVTCPTGLVLFFYGVFTGDIFVKRQVFCQPLV